MASRINDAVQTSACSLCDTESYSGKVVVKEHAGEMLVSGHICENCNSIVFFEKKPIHDEYKNRSSNDFSGRKGYVLSKLRGIYRKKLAKNVANKLGSFVKPNMVIVDLGAGNGDYSLALSESFPDAKVIAVDLALERPQALPDLIEYYSLEDFYSSDVIADLFVLNHVLEHIENPKKSLNEIKSKLDNSGKVYIEVPNAGSVWRKILGKYWAGYYWPFHLFVPSMSGLQILATGEGYEVESNHKVEAPIFGSSLMHSLLPYQLAVIIGLMLYPIQYLVSKFTGTSEAISVILRKAK